MKKILLILSVQFLYCSLLYAQAGWSIIYSNSTIFFHSNYFTDISTGYAVGLKFGQLPIVMKTTNAGMNWFGQNTPQEDSTGVFYRWVCFTDANTGFIAAAHLSNVYFGRILRTTNGGINWNTVPLSVEVHMTNIFFVNQNTGYASGRETILKTTDAGLTWVYQYTGINLYLFAISFTNANTGYVVGNSGTIIKTTNGGTNWISLNSGTSQMLWGLHFIDANTGIAVGGAANNTQNIILRTTDAGNNWAAIPYNNSSCLLWSVNFANQSTGWIIGWCGQIIKTTNGGSNWYNQGTFTQQLRTGAYINANTGYVAGEFDGVILKTTNGGDPVVNIEPVMNEIPVQYKLYQNYPNPFNPVTKIRFDISAGEASPEGLGQRVRIVVYNALGKETAVLVDALLDPGSHETSWNASEFPSGMYFYKIHTKKYTATKKIILIK